MLSTWQLRIRCESDQEALNPPRNLLWRACRRTECWQTETGLLLPTGMLPAPYGLALPQSAHFVAVAISADIAVVSSR